MGIPVTAKIEVGRSVVAIGGLAALTIAQCLGKLTPEFVGLVVAFVGGYLGLKTPEIRKNGNGKVGNIPVAGKGTPTQ